MCNCAHAIGYAPQFVSPYPVAHRLTIYVMETKQWIEFQLRVLYNVVLILVICPWESELLALASFFQTGSSWT